jgi:hypothetical protein
MPSIVEQYQAGVSGITTAKAFYLYTKGFLEQHKDTLMPEEKAEVFCYYVKEWGTREESVHSDVFSIKHNIRQYSDSFTTKERYTLNINETECAEFYRHALYGVSRARYRSYSPMTAGFNLSGADFRGVYGGTALLFLSVNLEGAILEGHLFEGSDFHDCNLTRVTIANDMIVNRCVFTRCVLNGVNFGAEALFFYNIFKDCDLRNVTFPVLEYDDGRSFTRCIVDNTTKGPFTEDELEDQHKFSSSSARSLYNVSDPQLMASWREHQAKGGEVPLMMAKALKEQEAAPAVEPPKFWASMVSHQVGRVNEQRQVVQGMVMGAK